MTDPLGESFALPCGARVKNRFLKSAMSEALAGPDTAPSGRHERLYAAFAEGGTGIVVTGNVMVDPSALGEPGNVVLQAGTDLAPFRAWATAGTASGTALWMQLNHPGKQSPIHLSSEPVAPSAIPLGSGLEHVFRTPRALTGDEIGALTERFGTAAGLAKEAGFQGVQIHGAHGYLVSQFLSPRHNTREDEWGGSAENRRRFGMDVYRAIRRAVGDGFPVSIKLNSADFQKGGFEEDESLGVVKALADEGIDLVEISGGTYEAPAMTGAKVKKSTAEREGYFLAFAERVRKAVPVPIAVTGGFRSARAMRAAVTSGATDFVGLARALAIDPGLPNKILGGEDYVSTAGDPSTGIRVVDRLAMLSVTWYEQQLRLIADGGAPDPRLGAWIAIARTVAHHGWGGLRQRRA